MLPGKLHLLVLLTAVGLSACGVRGFKRDGASHDDFMRDLRQCLYVANRPENPCYHDPIIGCERDKVRNQCMVDKGWTITRDGSRFMLPH